MTAVVRVFRVSMSEENLGKLEKLVHSGTFTSYSEAIRRAIELLVEKYFLD